MILFIGYLERKGCLNVCILVLICFLVLGLVYIIFFKVFEIVFYISFILFFLFKGYVFIWKYCNGNFCYRF